MTKRKTEVMYKKLVIFDFDGTLGDTSACVIASFQEAFRRQNMPEVDSTKIVELMGLSLEEIFRQLTKNSLNDGDYHKLVEVYRENYAKLLSSHTHAFPNVKDVLKSFVAAGKKIAIATSKKTEFAIRSCKILDIDQYISLYYGDDMVPALMKKPHPKMLQAILAELNFQKSDAVMVGDSEFDIQMGRAINMSTIAVTWGSHDEKRLLQAKPDAVVHSMKELKGIIL